MTKKAQIVTIRNIPSDLWWDAKILAAKRKMSLRDLIVGLLRREIKKENE